MRAHILNGLTRGGSLLDQRAPSACLEGRHSYPAVSYRPPPKSPHVMAALRQHLLVNSGAQRRDVVAKRLGSIFGNLERP